MYTPDDTIVAIATPHGRGGLGVVRLSGPDAHRIALALTGRDRPLAPRHATFARTSGSAGVADQVVLTYFKGPQSYTGEDVIEISAHGSPVLLRGIVGAAMAAGSRLAEPGEFTLRAFLNGRIDLVQAEAVRDLIDAVTPLQARAAFDQLEGTLTGRIRVIEARLFDLTAALEASIDFPHEGYHFIEPAAAARELEAVRAALSALLQSAARGRLIRDGLHVAIAGRPNVGKSSVFNRLADAERAIVADQPGTTRDVLSERVEVLGVPVTLVDTAGVRSDATDAVESEGILRATAAHESAAAVMLVLDRSVPLTSDDRSLLEATAGRRRVVVANKSDLRPSWEPSEAGFECITVSAGTGEGFDALSHALLEVFASDESPRDVPAITNMRHADLLVAARTAVDWALAAVTEKRSEEFVLADLHEASSRLAEITGARTPDDLLAAIFSRFCIGK